MKRSMNQAASHLVTRKMLHGVVQNGMSLQEERWGKRKKGIILGPGHLSWGKRKGTVLLC